MIRRASRREGGPRLWAASLLGGKRRSGPMVVAFIAGQVPRTPRFSDTPPDPFSGSRALAPRPKAQRFQVVAPNLAERAAVVARTLVANRSARLRRSDLLDVFRGLDRDYACVAAEECGGERDP